MTQYEPIFFDIETTGFNPMSQEWHGNTDYGARVTAIGVATCPNWRDVDSPEDVEIDKKVLWDTSEYGLLKTLSTVVGDIADNIRDGGGEPFMVSFNGRQFDHPYLGARYSRLRLDGSLFTHQLKRLDMMRALGKHWSLVDRYPSEDDCLAVAGIESEDPYGGSDMPEAYTKGQWDKIQVHVRHDTEEMVKLWALTKSECMKEFYDHYDIDADAEFIEEVDF